jgi:hypothetical protein
MTNPKVIPMRDKTMRRLSLYLNEHLADETRAVQLVHRAISENEGTPLRAFMEVLRWELEEDRDILERVMRNLGVHRSRIRVGSARLAEKVSRLKPDGRLSPLDELESLHREIEGKLDMWKALRYSVDGVDFDELIGRAERQGEEVERRRLNVAATALAKGV